MDAEKYATWIVANKDKKGTPEFETVAKAYKAAREMASADSAQPEQPRATLQEKIATSVPMRMLKGAKDPLDAAAQLLPRGLSMVSSLGGLNPNPISNFFDEQAASVDARLSQDERQYQNARKATGSEGFDIARMAGSALSPMNAAIATNLPVAASTGARALQGAFLGGVGGALSPVNTEENPSFAATKAGQVLTGATVGGFATPVLGKFGDVIAEKLNAFGKPNAQAIERAVKSYADDAGIDLKAISAAEMESLTQSALRSARSGSGENAAAAMRRADFESLNAPYTLGQITRDPAQFALEKNLSQTSPELTARFAEQARGLRSQIGEFSRGAMSQQEGGNALVSALRGADEDMRKGVTAAYNEARKSAGRDAEVPLAGLASDFGNVIEKYSSNVVKSLPTREFEKFGLLGGKATKVLTVDEADKLIKTINANQSTDKAVNNALGELREAVKRAVTQDAGVDDVFAPARKAAAQRFSLQEAIPALAASADNTVNPDTFVDKFIVSRSANTDQVKKLASLLREKSPEAYREARGQLGAYIERKALGENPAGDGKLNPAAYAKALRELGDGKLSAFFDPSEVKKLHTIARVGSFAESIPAGRMPNTSGNWGAISGLASRVLPFAPAAVNIASSAGKAVQRGQAERAALSAQLPSKPTPEQIRYLSKLLAGGAVVSGEAQGAQINQN